jgi:hypothetical protein
MPSNTEGRIALAIHALRTGQSKSIRASAKAYDVPYSTLCMRYSGVRSRRETRPAVCKLTLNEEGVLLQRILDLDA